MFYYENNFDPHGASGDPQGIQTTRWELLTQRTVIRMPYLRGPYLRGTHTSEGETFYNKVTQSIKQWKYSTKGMINTRMSVCLSNTILVNREKIEKNTEEWRFYKVCDCRVDCGRLSWGQGTKERMTEETGHAHKHHIPFRVCVARHPWLAHLER